MKKLFGTGLITLFLLMLTTITFANQSNTSLAQVLRENGFNHKTASWATVSTYKETKGKTIVTESKMWIKGDQIRLETKDKKQNQLIVFIDNGRERMLYVPDEKKAFKWSPQLEAMYGGILSSNIIVESANKRETAKKIGSGKINGKKCNIITYQSTVIYMNNSITSDVKEWLWKKEGIPLKSVVKTPKHKMQMGFMTVDVPASESINIVENIKLDQPIQDSLFNIPKGTRIETLELSDNGPQQVSDQEEVPAEVKNLLKGLF